MNLSPTLPRDESGAPGPVKIASGVEVVTGLAKGVPLPQPDKPCILGP